MKKTIRLSESDLHRVIKESVKRILRESDLQQHKYQIVAHLENPYDNKDSNAYVLNYGQTNYPKNDDYDFISDENNPEQERMERLMKYRLEDSFVGAIETHSIDVPYFIDEDGDGLYLLKRID